MDAWIIIAIGGALAGFVQGLSGFGFGLMSLAVWSWVLEPELAVPAVVFGSLLGQLLAAGALRKVLELSRILPFLIGGALGIPIGLELLNWVSPIIFKFGVGILLCVYCIAMLFINKFPKIERGGRGADGIVGWIGGVMGGFGGLPGPVPTIWCTLRGWPKDQQRLAFQSFNLFMHALTFVALIVQGTITQETVDVFVIVAPAVLVPTLIGLHLYRKFSEQLFKILVLGLLAISGLMLIISTAPVIGSAGFQS